jgi:hypothetical protein
LTTHTPNYKCSICSKTYSGSSESHSWGTGTSGDDCSVCSYVCACPSKTYVTEGDYAHHRECDNCNYIFGGAPHTWGGDAYCDDCGEYCNVHSSMSYTYTSRGDTSGHTKSKTCTNCDYSYSANYSHSWGGTYSWKCDLCGETCEVCNSVSGRSYYYTFIKGERNHGYTWYCNNCNLSYSGTEACEQNSVSEYSDITSTTHDYTYERCGKCSSYWYYDNQSHSWGSWQFSQNDRNHWHSCTGCGYTSAKEACDFNIASFCKTCGQSWFKSGIPNWDGALTPVGLLTVDGDDNHSQVGALSSPQTLSEHSHCETGGCSIDYASAICRENSYNSLGGWSCEIVDGESCGSCIVFKPANENNDNGYNDDTLNKVGDKYSITVAILDSTNVVSKSNNSEEDNDSED